MLVVQLRNHRLLILGETLFNSCINSVNDGGARDKLYNRFMNETASSSNNSPVIVCNVLDDLQKQKFGKAVGYDGIAMEALMYGGLRLTVHCFLFNLFVKYGMYHCLICKCNL